MLSSGGWRRRLPPGVLGAAGLVAYLPMTLLSPWRVAANLRNRKVLCITATWPWAGGPGVCRPVGPVCPAPDRADSAGPAGVGSTFQQLYHPVHPPQLVPADQLVRANGWMQLLNGGAFLLGPVIGAALYAAFPLPVVLLSDVVGAALASLALAGVKIPPLVRQEDQTGGFWAEFQAGLAVFRRDRALGRLVAAQALCMFFYAPLSAFYPLMTSDYFQRSAWYGSAVELAFAVGMVVSAFVFSKVGQVGGKLRLSSLGLFAMGGGAALCGLLPPTLGGWVVFAGLCLVLGAADNVHLIPLQAYLQETVPAEQMGRAFSVLTLISSAAMPVGLLVSSPLAEQVGVAFWFLLSGLAMLAGTAAILALRRPAPAPEEEGQR
ncbi:MAG: MFS transporter [Evtepia sp.]